MDRDGEFAEYVAVRWATLVRSAILMGCPRQDAEDLVQSTLARCYASWARVRSADSRDAYVHRILVNSHLDSRKRRWWGEVPVADVPEYPSETDEEHRVDETDALERALGGLSRIHRTVVVLRFYAGLSERETAQVLNISPGTVKSRLSRALTQLSKDDHVTNTPDGSEP
jgi:RNA polymerase sigma-70 factor (sigma-E family)